MKTDSFSYAQCEQLSPDSSTPQNLERKKLSDWVLQTGKFLNQVLFQPADEPKVWERADAKGNHYWEVYDPLTGERGYFASELEVRIWLDKGAGYRY